MDLKIISVHNHGDANEEYVLLRVTGDCDVGRYLLLDSTFTKDGHVSNKIRHPFWFPDKKVKKGELVSLRTRKGTDTEATANDGTKIHRFYWGLDSSVWNDARDAAILIEAADWSFFKAKG